MKTMKNVILVIAMITLTATKSLAQSEPETTTTDNREKLFLGIKAGANLSNVYDSEGDDFVADSKAGFAIGGFVSIPIGRYFGIQPEILFSQKGFKSTGTFLGSSYEMTRTTNFIDVPILASFKPIENLSILFGPQFSYLSKQTDDFEGGTISTTEEQAFSNANIRKNIFGLTGGVDLNFNHLVVGLRAGWDVKNNNGDGTSDTPRYKNMWYQATLGYRF
ncbi:porin family protein [Flavobacterium sangjuense]|nr:porin family protein [Flavobacterium sangjuense]